MYKEYVDEVTNDRTRWLEPHINFKDVMGRRGSLVICDKLYGDTSQQTEVGSTYIRTIVSNDVGVLRDIVLRVGSESIILKPDYVGHGQVSYSIKSEQFKVIAECVSLQGRIYGSDRRVDFTIDSSHGILQTMRSYYFKYIEPREKHLRDLLEAGIQAKLEKEEEARRLEKLKHDFLYRECPMCAETVKAKALLCKECGHKFEDGQQYRDRIKEWEDRAEPFGLDPWDEKAILQKEYEQTPEYKAQKAQELEFQNQLQEYEENKQREIRETEERFRRITAEVEAEAEDRIFGRWVIIIVLVFVGMLSFIINQ